MTRPKLLLADDSVTIRKVVELAFADEGIDVSTAPDGETAMQRFLEVEPDIVLLDTAMPGPDGYKLCEIIKQDEATRHIPVLLLVSSFEPFDHDEAERSCADGFLTKPFKSVRELVTRVHDLLRQDQIHPGNGTGLRLVDEIEPDTSSVDDEIERALRTLETDTEQDDDELSLSEIPIPDDELAAVFGEADEEPLEVWERVDDEESFDEEQSDASLAELEPVSPPEGDEIEQPETIAEFDAEEIDDLQAITTEKAEPETIETISEFDPEEIYDIHPVTESGREQAAEMLSEFEADELDHFAATTEFVIEERDQDQTVAEFDPEDVEIRSAVEFVSEDIDYSVADEVKQDADKAEETEESETADIDHLYETSFNEEEIAPDIPEPISDEDTGTVAIEPTGEFASVDELLGDSGMDDEMIETQRIKVETVGNGDFEHVSADVPADTVKEFDWSPAAKIAEAEREESPEISPEVEEVDAVTTNIDEHVEEIQVDEPVSVPELPPLASPVSKTSAELVELIAQRVIDKLSDSIIREVAQEAVPRITEKLIREALEEEEKD